MSKLKLILRNLIKATLQFLILPGVYNFYKKQTIQENLVLFADSKNDGIPYSLRAMYATVKDTGKYKIEGLCIDYAKLGTVQKVKAILNFMRLYANAKYVFICDYFLPVSSCNKRKETTVVQLWHSSGLQKKFGYDAKDDLGNMFFCKPTKNFDLVSVSADIVKKVFTKAWRLNDENVKSFGTSRTDILFNEKYKNNCIKKFYDLYPEAKNKKVILWAPTFRGNAVDGRIAGLEDILNIKSKLSNKYFFIIKLHPHLKEKVKYDNCLLKTEELYFVVDTLITDYSSIMYDFLLLDKEIIFFIPDYEEYDANRGLYIDYSTEFNFPIVINEENIINIIQNYKKNKKTLDKYKEKFIKMNKGKSSEKILRFLEEQNILN